MGWLFYTDRRIATYADEKTEIERLCTWDSDRASGVPLQTCKVSSTWYVAVRATPKPDQTIDQSEFVLDEDGSYVFAAIFLTKYDDGCWGYKDMDETMGPCEAKAPLSFLKKLSDLKNADGYAQKWRNNCKAWADIPSYAMGDIIKLAKPITLTDGTKVQDLERTSYRRRGRNMTCYKDIKTGSLCRLSKQYLIGSTLVTPAVATGSDVMAEFMARQKKPMRRFETKGES